MTWRAVSRWPSISSTSSLASFMFFCAVRRACSHSHSLLNSCDPQRHCHDSTLDSNIRLTCAHTCPHQVMVACMQVLYEVPAWSLKDEHGWRPLKAGYPSCAERYPIQSLKVVSNGKSRGMPGNAARRMPPPAGGLSSALSKHPARH